MAVSRTQLLRLGLVAFAGFLVAYTLSYFASPSASSPPVVVAKHADRLEQSHEQLPERYPASLPARDREPPLSWFSPVSLSSKAWFYPFSVELGAERKVVQDDSRPAGPVTAGNGDSGVLTSAMVPLVVKPADDRPDAAVGKNRLRPVKADRLDDEDLPKGWCKLQPRKGYSFGKHIRHGKVVGCYYAKG